MESTDNRSLLDEVISSDQHLELVNGKIVKENRTSVHHNMAVEKIARAFGNHIEANAGKCQVFTENVALFVNELCGDGNFFLPDVMVVCDANGINDDGVHVAPAFVAEVTSESTKVNDYNTKLDIYKKIGVGEYWVVDLQRKVVFKYLKEDSYIPRFNNPSKPLHVSSYKGLCIDLSFIDELP